MLAVGVSRWLCLWFILSCFCSRSQPLVKLAIALFFLYCCCNQCLQSRGCPVASHDWAPCVLLVASASCLLHGREMLPLSSFLSAVRRFFIRRRAVLRSALELASMSSNHPISVRICHNFSWFRVCDCRHDFSAPHIAKFPLKKYTKGLKSSGFSYICVNHFTITKCGSWLQLPHSNSKSYVYVAETPTRGYVTTHS